MKYSYRTKLFFLVTLLIWLIVAVFIVFSFSRDQQYRTDLLNSQQQTENESIAEAHAQHGQTWGHLDSLYKDVRLTILDKNGKVIYDHNKNIINESHANRSEFRQAIVSGSGYTIRRASSADEKDYFYSATLCDSIVVRTALPYTVSLSKTLQVDYLYISILVIIGIVASIITWIFLSRATRSIKTLRDFAVNAEKDDNFNPEDYIFPDDELGEISDEIVNLYKKEKQSNSSAAENLNKLLFEEQEKARIKQQLSSNISHELKTPIHAINACLETIATNHEALSVETKMDLINKSLEQSKRLIALITDLSMVTRLSEGKMQINTYVINLTEIIAKVAKEVDLQPLEKQMRVSINMPSDVEIEANSDLVESIFRNLINNALNYSGGRDIFIEMTGRDDNKIYMRFADNGIGVSSEHLSRIFERFYRPDEGRNRLVGGTGLGLSIVKNAILFHGGEITAQNMNSGGLEFRFSFAIKHKN